MDFSELMSNHVITDLTTTSTIIIIMILTNHNTNGRFSFMSVIEKILHNHVNVNSQKQKQTHFIKSSMQQY